MFLKVQGHKHRPKYKRVYHKVVFSFFFSNKKRKYIQYNTCTCIYKYYFRPYLVMVYVEVCIEYIDLF